MLGRDARAHRRGLDEPVVGGEEGLGLAQIATSGRPVAARATLTAAVVASDPFLANFTISAPGTWARNVSAARSSQTLGRLKLMPSAAARAAAATTGS